MGRRAGAIAIVSAESEEGASSARDRAEVAGFGVLGRGSDFAAAGPPPRRASPSADPGPPPRRASPSGDPGFGVGIRTVAEVALGGAWGGGAFGLETAGRSSVSALTSSFR